MPRVQTTEGFGRLVNKFVAVGYDDPKKRHVVVDDPEEVEGMAAFFGALVGGARVETRDGQCWKDAASACIEEYEPRMRTADRPILIIEEP